jgi:hypothetical protein
MQRSFKENKVAEFDIKLKYIYLKRSPKGMVRLWINRDALIHTSPFRFAKYFIKKERQHMMRV